jgi:hypothetical protein|tara:strand:- start:45 stop:194 length:150 start_codon:yes stop_codon:yes gene_type:complete
MIKGIFIGALLVVGLVGYGILDTNTIADAGDRVKNGVNYVATSLDEATR